MLKTGLIGCGNMGGGHLNNYYRFNKENDLLNLVCVCDIREERLRIVNQEEHEIRLYRDLDEMLEKEKLDMVTIALPTYLHHDAAIKCLEHGIHVLCEKPMALTAKDCDEMIAAAEKAGKLLLIGQCLRFAGNYVYLKKLVEEETYGRVISAHFIRSSSCNPPAGWNNWFLTKDLSGGGLYDLHIHDADIMRWLFGNPTAVSAVTRDVFETSKNDSFAGVYHYPDMVISAESDWSWKKFPFTADYTVNFENATLSLHNNVLTLATRDEPMHTVNPADIPGIPTGDPYYEETRYLASCIRDGKPNTYNPPFESREVIRLLNAVEKSGNTGMTVSL